MKYLPLDYCHNLLDAAREHRLWTCKRKCYCQVVLNLPSLSLSFCLSWFSWQLMSLFSAVVCLRLAGTDPSCHLCFLISSGKTGPIWSRPEFAFRIDGSFSLFCLSLCMLVDFYQLHTALCVYQNVPHHHLDLASFLTFSATVFISVIVPHGKNMVIKYRF